MGVTDTRKTNQVQERLQFETRELDLRGTGEVTEGEEADLQPSLGLGLGLHCLLLAATGHAQVWVQRQG
jgi:hypothetical protein